MKIVYTEVNKEYTSNEATANLIDKTPTNRMSKLNNKQFLMN